MTLKERCFLINDLFDKLTLFTSRNVKEMLVSAFRKVNEDLNSDLDYCFEVLAGKHKLGYTYNSSYYKDKCSKDYDNSSIRDFVEYLCTLSATDDNIMLATFKTPFECREFISKLVNREFKVGYSNREAMITELSPMLAKKYPDSHHDQMYFIQEKLDGNRCIAYYDNGWKFQSRSGKPLKVDFDLHNLDEYRVYDGEIMTIGHAGSRDFNSTSGAINGKYTDKSQLHYYIYDIVDTNLPYKRRKEILDTYEQEDKDYTILKLLDYIHVYANPEYNWQLDEWLDKIVDKGGEGIILRDPDAKYQHKRTDALLKYKKVQTMDLRITDWNLGNGKYEDAIGSFHCETDDGSIVVNVSGMPDEIHFSNPEDWIGKIIEVSYFDISKSPNNNYSSLRFPRLKRVRDDKNTTSIY